MPTLRSSHAESVTGPTPPKPTIPAIHSSPTPEAKPRTFLPIRRILCPVDFSEFSRAAVVRAVALARPFKAEITALFVLPYLFPTEEETSACAAPIAPDPGIQAAIAEDLEEFLRPARDAGLPIRLCVRSGGCASHILAMAMERESDIIVMGTHGRSGFEKWVLGSVTDSVLRRAPCPVLAVPRTVPRSMPAGPLSGRILCAVDLSARSARTLSYALELGQSTGSIVTLLHVWDGVGGPRVRALREADLSRRLHAAALVAGGPPKCPAEEVVLSGKAHREILRLAEAQQTGVVILGSADRTLGSTAGRVVREARAPVLIVRSAPDERQS
jgi:nucleotide-binding universal stress UspA family protein